MPTGSTMSWRGVLRAGVLCAVFAAAFPVRTARGQPGEGARGRLTEPGGEEEVLFDPELDGVPVEEPRDEEPVTDEPTAGDSSLLRLVLHSRWGIDTRWEAPREDIVEGTQIAIFEAEHERSEDLVLAVGVRARHVFATRRDSETGGGRRRNELDVVPLSAYADGTVGDGMHLRAGYQVITLGRFDLFSATNFLAVYDLRSGPTTLPEANHVGQPALRYDLDKIDWFTLQAYYVPFFVPHLVTVWGTDYALLKNLDRDISQAPSAAELRRALEDALGRSEVIGLTTQGVRALAPEPSLDEPQGALRATFRSKAGELSLTAGTALERLPVIVLSPELQRYAADPGSFSGSELDLIASGPVRLTHNRFFVASADAATDIGPVQVGLETAYMANRTLLGAVEGDLPRAGQSDMAHVGARAEFVRGTEWAAIAEGFVSFALDDPAAPATGWLSFEGGDVWRGAAGAVRWSPGRTGLRFELGGLVFSGPTAVIVPRAEWEVASGLFVELGATIVEGPAVRNVGAVDTSLGGVYDDVDQVFTGVRWLP